MPDWVRRPEVADILGVNFDGLADDSLYVVFDKLPGFLHFVHFLHGSLPIRRDRFGQDGLNGLVVVVNRFALGHRRRRTRLPLLEDALGSPRPDRRCCTEQLRMTLGPSHTEVQTT